MRTRRIAPILLAALVLVGAGGLAACTPQRTAVDAARSQMGTPYRSGGAAPGGFDCSGLTSWAWKQAGVSIPRTSSEQHRWTTRVSRADLQAGDLVFYSSAGPRGRVSHVALYAGGGKIVHARKTGVPVEEQNVDTWWKSNLVGYGRIPASALR